MNVFLCSGFRGVHLPIPPTNLLDLPCDPTVTPDPFDTADFEVPNEKIMVEAFMAGLAKEADNEYRHGGLLDLLANLPDPSKTLSLAESFTFADAQSKGMVPEASEDTLRAFSPSEMKLYKHASSHKWKADELVSTIKLTKSVEFNVDDDINVDLHKRVAAAIAQGYFTSHNMRESNSDGDQDLTLWL